MYPTSLLAALSQMSMGDVMPSGFGDEYPSPGFSTPGAGPSLSIPRNIASTAMSAPPISSTGNIRPIPAPRPSGPSGGWQAVSPQMSQMLPYQTAVNTPGTYYNTAKNDLENWRPADYAKGPYQQGPFHGRSANAITGLDVAARMQQTGAWDRKMAEEARLVPTADGGVAKQLSGDVLFSRQADPSTFNAQTGTYPWSGGGFSNADYSASDSRDADWADFQQDMRKARAVQQTFDPYVLNPTQQTIAEKPQRSQMAQEAMGNIFNQNFRRGQLGVADNQNRMGAQVDMAGHDADMAKLLIEAALNSADPKIQEQGRNMLLRQLQRLSNGSDTRYSEALGY